MYHYILFDLDGTLTDSKEGIFKSIHYALDKLGLPVPGDDVLRKFVGPPLWESFMAHCGMTRQEAEQAVTVFRERYTVKGLFENAAVAGCPELLRRLKDKGYRLALASSKPQSHCLPILERFGYADSLDVVAGSEGGGDEDKAAVIRKALARLGVPQEEMHRVLMVGDRMYDVRGAKDCGVDCVGVEFCGYADDGELKNAGAVAVVGTVAELERFILTP